MHSAIPKLRKGWVAKVEKDRPLDSRGVAFSQFWHGVRVISGAK